MYMFYFHWKSGFSISRGYFLDSIPWQQDMLLSLHRPISILGEVTTVNMSFHASYQSKDGQSMLLGTLGRFGFGFFRVLFWLFHPLFNAQERRIWGEDPNVMDNQIYQTTNQIFTRSNQIQVGRTGELPLDLQRSAGILRLAQFGALTCGPVRSQLLSLRHGVATHQRIV